MNIQPTRDHVLVQSDAPDETTESGLHIPERAQKAQHPNEGTVLAVGPDVTVCKEGDRVVLGRVVGLGIDLGNGDGSRGFLTAEEHIMAVLTGPPRLKTRLIDPTKEINRGSDIPTA